MSMGRLLAEISRSHFPRPPATLEEIAAFEARVGWRLDDDLRAFYLHCNGAELFEPTPESNYSILPLAKVQRARVVMRGRDDDSAGPADWYALVDCQDSDYVLLDVAGGRGLYPLLDGWHETYPHRCRRVAASFGEFLERALESEDQLFWLNK